MRLIAYNPVVQKHIPASSPRANVQKKEEGYVIEFAVPGLSKSDFEIRLDGKVLAISGKRSRHEFGIPAFERRFQMPDTIVNTEIKASYEDGILRVFLPEHKESPRRVEVA